MNKLYSQLGFVPSATWGDLGKSLHFLESEICQLANGIYNIYRVIHYGG